MEIFGIMFDDSFENICSAYYDFVLDSMEEDVTGTPEKDPAECKAA